MRLTIAKLIDIYREDEVSPYHDLRYVTRNSSDNLMRRLRAEHGAVSIKSIRFKTLKGWQRQWDKAGHVTMTHAFFQQLRTLINFGLSYLEDDECARVSAILRTLKVPQGPSRTVHLTAEQADLIRAHARAGQFASMALAQAFQFECAFRQKDVIGEWVPVYEPGESEILWKGQKWLRGIRWSEIDDNLVLKHITSKKLKPVTHDLKLCPMVIDELVRAYPGLVVQDADGENDMVVDRSVLPREGAIIIHEKRELPWLAPNFRFMWRWFATAAGIPDNVQNRDSRSGAATEATNSGAGLEEAKELLGHADIAMTQIYSRDRERKAAKAQRARILARQQKQG